MVVNNLDDERYAKLLVDNELDVQPCRSRPRKT